MARPTKRHVEGGTGRTTPKGGPAKAGAAASSHGDGGPAPSSRYTPPSANALYRPSPMWVPIVMFGLFGLGFLVIFLNYTEVLWGAPSGWYLMGGLGAILAGIITATQLR